MGATNGWRFKRRASAVPGRRHRPDRHAAGATRDSGLWRGPNEARWIVQRLHGVPPPRASAHIHAELVPHG